MSGRLREELRREAGRARTYDVYAASVARARRGRRRAVAVWAAIVAVLALAVPVLPRAASPGPAAEGGAVSVPDRLGLPAYGSRGVAGMGAASVAYTGYGGRFGPFFDDADTYALVGAASEDYRTIFTSYVDDRVLLAPDGTVLALPGRLVDLRTGDERALPGEPLAWSPDGRRLAVADDRVRIVDVASGATADLGPAVGTPSAAWSPDGGRLAYEVNHRVTVGDATGRTLREFTPPGSARLAGKGAWTPDGRAVAVTPEDAWAPLWFDPVTGREVTGPALPAITGDTLKTVLLGWRPDGSALVFVLRTDRPRLLALTPRAAEPVPAMVLPAQVSYLDIADGAIAADRVRPGDPPFPVGPRLWLRLGVVAVAGVLLGLLIRWRRERARVRRVVATPWGTTHGPLV